MKKETKLVFFSIVLVLLGSILAQMFNTSFYSVKVKRIEFETDTGILSGLLYLPKDAGATDPRPTIITTHGYLNSAEMQDAALKCREEVMLFCTRYKWSRTSSNKQHMNPLSLSFLLANNSKMQFNICNRLCPKDSEGIAIIGVLWSMWIL